MFIVANQGYEQIVCYMDAQRDFKPSGEKTEIGTGKTKQKIIGEDCNLAASKGKFLVGKMRQAEK